MKIEEKLDLSEDRGLTQKLEDIPMKNQADGQPIYSKLYVKYIFFVNNIERSV